MTQERASSPAHTMHPSNRRPAGGSAMSPSMMAAAAPPSWRRRQPLPLPMVLLLALLVLLASRDVEAMFYVVVQPSTVEQCFLVEQPQGTLVVVDYELSEFAKQKVNLVANLKSGPTGPNTKMIQQMDMDKEEGQFKFATVKDGFHSVCVVPAKVTKPTKVGLSISFGQADQYYADLAKEAHIDALEATIMKLNAQMGQILNEADYQKDKEVGFHQQCERMNAAARWWPILQVAILLITGAMWAHNMKTFFKKRRLV